MVQPEAWVPFRWPSGPLETALQQAPSADAAEVHNAWHQPATLAFLKDSPVNCLVVTWAAGKLEDAEQQRTLAPLVEAAHGQGLAVVGRVFGDAPAAFEAAQKAKLDGLVADKAPDRAPLPVIGATKIDDFAPSGNTHVVALSGLPWPQIPMSKGSSGGAQAGPTGSPWIDSNGWAIQLFRAKAPDRTPWVLTVPPAENRVFRVEAYLLAVCDAWSSGARWPVAIDRDARKALAAGNEKALKDWRRVADAIRYFEAKRPDILAQKPVAKLGVCSDFSGENAYLADEFLNLSARRLLLYRVLDKATANAAALEGLKGVVWIDEKAPEGRWAGTLKRFVEGGGLLIAPASASAFAGGLKPAARQEVEYATYSLGSGLIAVARKPWSDPFVLAAEAHMMLSRRHDVVRLYNAGTSTVLYTEGDGKARLQILSFAGAGFGFPVTAFIAAKYKTADLEVLGAAGRKPLEVVPRENGIELKLPNIGVYASIELGG